MTQQTINTRYSINYSSYTWEVVDNLTGKGIVCFPTQIMAAKWIENKLLDSKKTMSAVAWLALRYHHREGYLKQEDIAEAKEMEKEQRIKDYNAGYTDAQCNHINDAENYVNEQDYLNG